MGGEGQELVKRFATYLTGIPECASQTYYVLLHLFSHKSEHIQNNRAYEGGRIKKRSLRCEGGGGEV